MATFSEGSDNSSAVVDTKTIGSEVVLAVVKMLVMMSAGGRQLLRESMTEKGCLTHFKGDTATTWH